MHVNTHTHTGQPALSNPHHRQHLSPVLHPHTNHLPPPPPCLSQLPANKDSFRKTWNPKYTLRSHFDGVRALAFHPVEPVLVTVSEDHTLKLWNLQKTVPAKKQVVHPQMKTLFTLIYAFMTCS